VWHSDDSAMVNALNSYTGGPSHLCDISASISNDHMALLYINISLSFFLFNQPGFWTYSWVRLVSQRRIVEISGAKHHKKDA